MRAPERSDADAKASPEQREEPLRTGRRGARLNRASPSDIKGFTLVTALRGRRHLAGHEGA